MFSDADAAYKSTFVKVRAWCRCQEAISWANTDPVLCIILTTFMSSLRWRHNEHDGVSPDSRLFAQVFVQEQIKEKLKAPPHWLGVTGGERASNAEMFLFVDVIQ